MCRLDFGPGRRSTPLGLAVSPPVLSLALKPTVRAIVRSPVVPRSNDIEAPFVAFVLAFLSWSPMIEEGQVYARTFLVR